MDTRASGKVTDVSEKQERNAPCPIDVMRSRSTTDESDPQYPKALYPSEATLFGMLTAVSELH